MPGIPFRRLAGQFVVNLEQLGALVIELSPPDKRPYRVAIGSAGRQSTYLLFLWTVTPGGGGPGVRPPDEWRIQITNATRFPLEAGARTVVGGWNPDWNVYVFWDPRRHSMFSANSPGFHVKQPALERAHHSGVATHVATAREGREVVVCVTRPYLLWYLQDGYVLHDLDEDAGEAAVLADATPEQEQEFTNAAIADEATFLRRHRLVEIMRAYRAARFRPDVLSAYQYRCAVCGIALKLIDAAHIVPVQHPRGTDSVTNGLALCRLHHAAYDNALLGIRSDYTVLINPLQVRRLRAANLLAGLEGFQRGLPEQIAYPNVIEVRPDRERLRLGLEVRGWPGNLVA